MSRPRALSTLALALALSLPTSGCVSLGSAPPTVARAGDSTLLREADDPERSDLDLAVGHGELLRAGPSLAHNDAGRVGLIVIACMVLPVVVLVDLIALPFTAPSGHPFACTIFVVDTCFRGR